MTLYIFFLSHSPTVTKCDRFVDSERYKLIFFHKKYTSHL